MSKIVDFLEGSGEGPHGFLFSQVLLYTDPRLESDHNYIQWLFPLKEESQCVPDSPTLTDADVGAILQSPQAQQNLTTGYFLMLRFYTDHDHWLTYKDHNHLRISRILNSLSLLGGEVGKENAREFFRVIMRRVQDTNTKINSESLKYWRDAVPQ